MNVKIIAAIVAVAVVAAGVAIIIPSDDVTWDTLKEKDQAAYEKAKALSTSDKVTIEDVANFSLYYCKMSDNVTGKTDFDRKSMIETGGILDGITKGMSEQAKTNDLTVMLSNSYGMKEAYKNGTPYFYDGKTVPVFDYTEVKDKNYSNKDSTIMRYCVYVETEYDTDSDGYRDLVKVFLQVPKSAMEGNYKAPVILECNPYGLGTISDEVVGEIKAADSYDLSQLYSQPTPRGYSKSIDSMSLAMSSDTSKWMSSSASYDSASSYDYYLVRGYAVAICCGLGTYDSEGFVCTGTDIEISCYKNVVEWFDGKATAFTDRNYFVSTSADWSSGDVCTMGVSYLGTIQIGLAALGIDNLKAVIPTGAICNWYEYAYSQGAMINGDGVEGYVWNLAGFCSSRYLVSGFSDTYKDYLAKLNYDEKQLKGNYTDGKSDFWSSRDYTNMDLKPGTAVLLVEGLNEYNVRTKQTELAYSMFSEAGYEVKTILHLGLHQDLSGGMYDPSYESVNGAIQMGEDNFKEIENEWVTHYLFGIDNDAEERPNVSVQSNVDGSWSFYDDLSSTSTATWVSSSEIVNEISKAGYDADPVIFKKDSDDGRSTVMFAINDNITVNGVAHVSLDVATTNVVDNMVMTICLYDVCDDGVTSYVNKCPKQTNCVKPTGEYLLFGSGQEDYAVVEYYESEYGYQLITSGTVDINNPSSDYRSSTAVFETVEQNKYYTYNVYLNPTTYTIAEGHSLAVVVYTFDPNNACFKDMTSGPFELLIDESSIEVEFGTI